MKVNTRERKKARKGFEGIFGRNELVDQVAEILVRGKQGWPRKKSRGDFHFMNVHI